jgi:hypothetical protein
MVRTIALCIAAVLASCASSSDKSSQHADQGSGGVGSGGASGVAGSPHPGTGGAHAGSGGKPSVGTGGSGADGGTGGSAGGACNLDCVRGKHCELKPKATCVDDASDASDAGVDAGGASANGCGGATRRTCPGMGACVSPTGCDPMADGAACPGECNCYVQGTCEQGKVWISTPDVCDCVPAGEVALHWFPSCGRPVCPADDNTMFDDPNVPNCTDQQLGEPCTKAGDACDGVLKCGSVLTCAAEMPRNCPVSRARYKRDIRYLGDAERAQVRDQLVQMPLAAYRYKSAPDVPQLGFIIDDVEPSVAASGDHVNLYGYLSMAVAAIQVQQRQIAELEKEVHGLREQIGTDSSASMCTASDKTSQ